MKNSLQIMPELSGQKYFSDFNVNSLHIDSREVKEEGVFFAIKGNRLNGNDFIEEAVSRGAALIISDEHRNKKNIVYCNYLREYLGIVASRFFSDPSKKLTTFCATGTNGKTTSVESFAQLCKKLGYKCGYLSTIGKSINGNKIEESTTLTTPDPIYLNHSFSEMVLNGSTYAAIEASSHGLDQNRLNGIDIDYGVLTSFSQDHLDYHESIKNYEEAKSILFKKLNPKNSIIQIDSDFGQRLYKDIAGINQNVFCVSLTKDSDYFADFKRDKGQLNVSLKSPYGVDEFSLSTVSKYLASNVICSMVALNIEGVKMNRLAEIVSEISFPSGRLERISIGKKDVCYLDSAHTPDALKNALNEIRDNHEGQIWCVFGCGGDRDKDKRPIMGAIAEKYSDHVVVTDDNPRNESSKKIINDILAGINETSKVHSISDRKKAIKFALEEMESREGKNIMLLAGKGHENYQLIGPDKNYFDDKKTVISLLKK